MSIAVQLLVILLLITANGVFAMAEIAVLSARRTRLRQMADEGNAGAQAALELLDSPNRFLSTVQIGITLVGVLAGAISGATIGQELGQVLGEIPLIAPYAEAIGIALVVATITYLTLLIGELVPKRLALNNAERVAAAVARPMRLLSRLAAPLVTLLSASTSAVVRLLGAGQAPSQTVSEDEVRMLIEEGARAGVFDTAEYDITERVFQLDDVHVSLLMTPRPDVIWLDINDPREQLWEEMARSERAQFPVGDGTLDNTLGVVSVKNVWANMQAGVDDPLRQALVEPLYVPENTQALRALEMFKQAGARSALVINEYGGIEGILTRNDLLEAIVGEIEETDDTPLPEATQREDGSWLVDARLSAVRLKEILDLDELPGEAEAGYETVGGLVMMALGQIPQATDSFRLGDLRFEVVDMDGRRVDKVLVEHALPASGEAATQP